MVDMNQAWSLMRAASCVLTQVSLITDKNRNALYAYKGQSVAVQTREAAQEAVRRSEENLEAARARAAETAGATKSQAQQAAEQAVHEAEQTAAEAREKVLYYCWCFKWACSLCVSSIKFPQCLRASRFVLNTTAFITGKLVSLARRRRMHAQCTQIALSTCHLSSPLQN